MLLIQDLDHCDCLHNHFALILINNNVKIYAFLLNYFKIRNTSLVMLVKLLSILTFFESRYTFNNKPVKISAKSVHMFGRKLETLIFKFNIEGSIHSHSGQH